MARVACSSLGSRAHDGLVDPTARSLNYASGKLHLVIYNIHEETFIDFQVFGHGIRLSNLNAMSKYTITGYMYIDRKKTGYFK